MRVLTRIIIIRSRSNVQVLSNLTKAFIGAASFEVRTHARLSALLLRGRTSRV